MLLHYIKYINEKYPHIGSEVAYTVKQADPEKDYYFPETFRSSASVVDVTITKNLCEKVSCNSATNKGACKFGDPASLYRIGDMEKFKMQCQPACYNLKNQRVFDDDGKEVVQSHRFEWNKHNKCEFVNSAVTWMEKPFYRSMEIYEKRVNDLELGFNYDEDLDMYFYNKYYCNVYFDTYDPATKNCKTAWYDFIANVVVGENIMKLLKAGISYIENGNTIIPARLPQPPKIDDKWKVENWKKDINPNFVVPNTEIKFDVTGTGKSSSTDATKRLADRYASDTGTKKDESGNNDDKNKEEGNSSQNVVEAVLVGLLESIVSTEFLESIAVDMSTTILVTQLKNFALKILEKLSVSMAEAVLKLNVQLFENILKASVVNVAKNIIQTLAVRSLGLLFQFLAKSLVLLSTGIGIVLMVVQIFDLLFVFWDPLGFNNKYPDGYLEKLYDNSKYALRKQLNTNDPVLTFEYLCSILLSEAELTQISLQSLVYSYDYLSHLTINASGSRIDIGQQLDNDKIDIPNKMKELVVKNKIYNYRDFQNYEQSHMDRIQTFGNMFTFSIISMVFGLGLMAFKLYTFALLIFLVSILFNFASFLNIQFNV
ncbi:unnamed protein product [Danaus chrysippus]|uniref:(African queen) hypothetical protein n=1 Tax=Danaus chrysippus TaxID=151541 RepID=A0A8J2VS09_9NEOP|nr:unnamed protein product [Danaus chrysippus]